MSGYVIEDHYFIQGAKLIRRADKGKDDPSRIFKNYQDALKTLRMILQVDKEEGEEE